MYDVHDFKVMWYNAISSQFHAPRCQETRTAVCIISFVENTDWFIGIDVLGNPEFPLILESIKWMCQTEQNSTSSYNVEEITAVLKYVHRILIPRKWNNRYSDIGIISPYRSQCDRIRAECDKEGFEDITIGSYEKFQGQEKPIIILIISRGACSDLYKGKIT